MYIFISLYQMEQEPSNDSVLCQSTDFEKSKDHIKHCSIDKQHQALPIVILRIYCIMDSNTNFEPVILFNQERDFRKQISIPFPSSVFLNKTNSRTRVIKTSILNEDVLKLRKMSGYRSLGNVTQHFGILQKPCFDIQSPKVKNNFSEREEILDTTFVNLKEQGLNSMTLKNDDIIKFGRELFQITIIDETISPNLRWFKQMKVQKKIRVGNCRICLCSQTTDDNFFITPCACSGSCEYVHMECLREWLHTRIVEFKNEKIIAYNLQIFYCEVCKTNLPKFLNVEGELTELFPMVVKHDSFCMLQKICDKSAMAYVIPFKEDKKIEVAIGRSEENDLILNDMSISRKHAILRIFAGGEIQLSDNKSKFGTFVQLRRTIPNCEKINLVNNRYTFDFSINPK